MSRTEHRGTVDASRMMVVQNGPRLPGCRRLSNITIVRISTNIEGLNTVKIGRIHTEANIDISRYAWTNYRDLIPQAHPVRRPLDLKTIFIITVIRPDQLDFGW